MTMEAEAKEDWGLAIAELVSHQDECPDCTPPTMAAPCRITCPIGMRLMDAELVAYMTWSRARFPGVVR